MVYSIDTNVFINYMNIMGYDNKKTIRIIRKNEELFLSFFMIKESIKVYNRILEKTLERIIKVIKKKNIINIELLKNVEEYEDNKYFYNLILNKYNSLTDKNIQNLLKCMSNENLNKRKIIDNIKFKRNIIISNNWSEYKGMYLKYFDNILFDDSTDKKMICDIFTLAYLKNHKIKFYTFDKQFKVDYHKVKLPKFKNKSEYIEFVLL